MSGAAVSGLASFLERLQASLAQRRADGQGLAMLFVYFGVIGRIDGVWGHPMGDAVRARFVSKVSAEVLRSGDFLGEIGRDGLACVLETTQSPGVALLAADKILRALDEPVLVGEDEIHAKPSIGIAVFPEHGDNDVALLQHARTACRHTWNQPQRVVVYAEALDRPEAEALRYENRLRAALAQEAIELVFQPQIDLRSGLVSGVEALLCWGSGEPGLVPVSTAIAVAESTGSVGKFTGWMLNNALRNCGEFRQTAGLDLRVGVNLSAKCLLDPDLPDFIARALGTWGLRPGRLVLEIAGTAVLEASSEAVATLKRIREIGVRLSIDDVGAGYAALANLATLPFSELKIDLAAAPGMLDAGPRLSVVQSLVELAHKLRFDAIACGVADQAQADRVKEIGFDYMQGDQISPPHDAVSFARTFAQR